MIAGEMGLVSVIVPTFNRARSLLEAMESVYGQTYRPIELIIVDDGSTDATHEIASKWGEDRCRDRQFRFTYLFQQNAGAPAARNLGTAASHGEFIQFLDSDDLLYPERLSRLVNLFNENHCDYIYTGLDRFCGHCGQVTEQHLPKATADHLTVMCQGRLWGYTGQFCWRRELIEEIGDWDTDMVVYQDYDYISRTVLASNNGIALREILCRERMGGWPRISDVRTTREGYESFLRAVSKLCAGIKSPGVPPVARKSLAAYLYYKALLSYPRYPDIGKQIGELARSIEYKPNSSKGFVEPLVWQADRFASAIFLLAIDVKNRLLKMGSNSKGARKHVCSSLGTGSPE